MGKGKNRAGNEAQGPVGVSTHAKWERGRAETSRIRNGFQQIRSAPARGQQRVLVVPVSLSRCILPGSSVRGILQPRIQEWVAIPFSRGSSQPRD